MPLTTPTKNISSDKKAEEPPDTPKYTMLIDADPYGFPTWVSTFATTTTYSTQPPCNTTSFLEVRFQDVEKKKR